MLVTLPLQPGAVPIDKAPYRVHPRTQEIIDKCVHELEEQGIVGRQASPNGSQVTIVIKSNRTPRLCVDNRSTINKFLVRESGPLPNIEARVDAVAGAQYISLFDVQSAFHQMVVAPEDRKNGVRDSTRQWVFNRLPFGLKRVQ